MSQPQKLKIVFGAMTIGKPGTLGARIHDFDQVNKLLTVFKSYGHEEVDTARIYGGGSSEEMLGAIEWKDQGLVMDTKLYPNSAAVSPAAGYRLTPEGLKRGLLDSLKALRTEQVDLFYLHGPDREIPLEQTLEAVDSLYKQGYFKRFGISNYMAWEVAKIYELCDKRMDQTNGVSGAFYAFSPLAGGMLTGRYQKEQIQVEPGSRFDPTTIQGAKFRDRYWNDAYFNAIERTSLGAQKHRLTLAEVALRWLAHHSKLQFEFDDAIIVGASSPKHLEDNLDDLRKGPLPEELLNILEDAWDLLKSSAPAYFH